MTLPRRFFPLVLIAAGAITISGVVLPLGFSFLRYYFLRPPALLNPLAEAGVPGPFIVNVLGVSSTDYTRASNWFVSPPAPAPVTTPVKYFTLTLPRLKLFNVPVEVNGADLKKNAIHYPGTALPGTPGNAVIFGHSALPQFYSSGNPLTIFNPLLEAKVGDDVVINFDGVTYRYTIRTVLEIEPTQIEVLTQRFDRSEITLITCVPLGTYWHRLVVRAELVN